MGEATSVPPIHSRLPRVADTCALLTAAIGLSVVAGWLLDIDSLKRVLPGLVAMKFNTALGFVLAGAGLWWRRRSAAAGSHSERWSRCSARCRSASTLRGWISASTSSSSATIAASPEADYLPGTHGALHRALLPAARPRRDGERRRPAPAPDPGPRGGVGVSRRLGHAAELLALAAIVIGGFSLIAYPTGAVYLRQLPGSISMALPTAAAFVVLGVGILCAADGMVAQTLRLRGTGRVLWIGFGVLTCLLVTVGIVFTVNIQTLAKDIDAQANVARPRREATLELENRVLGYALAVRLARAGDAQDAAPRPSTRAASTRHLAEYRALATTDRQRELAARFARPVARTFTRWEPPCWRAGGQLSQEESARLVTLRRPAGGPAQGGDAARGGRGVRGPQGHHAPRPRSDRRPTVAASRRQRAPRAGDERRRRSGRVEAGADRARAARVAARDALQHRRRRDRLRHGTPGHVPQPRRRDAHRLERRGGARDSRSPTVLRLINEQTREPAADIAEQVLREGRVVELANHTALVTRDGREVPIEDSAAPITDNAGNVTGAVLVFHDVTQRRRANDELKESEARLCRSQEMAHLGSWELDSSATS